MNGLVEWLTRRTLIAALIAGGAARLVSALVGLGFHARDDYFHVLAPALAWLDQPGFVWETSDLPGAGLRSQLVPRLSELVVYLSRTLGVSEPESVLRVLHMVAGAYSLLAVWAMWLLASRLLTPRGARIATWLTALHFAMPYLGTRLLIEAMAIPPLIFGLYFATMAGLAALFAGLLIGLACWLRYQVAVLAIGVAVHFVLQRRWRELGYLAAGGLLALAVQGCFDTSTVGVPFLPLWNNIMANAAPHEALTRMSPMTYVWIWLVLTIPPVTVTLIPAMWREARPLRLIWLPFFMFVIAHMLIPHKEERFMAPALPLFLIMLAAGLVRPMRPAFAVWFVAVHAVALGITVTHRSQAGQRAALTHLRRDPDARAIVAMGPEMPSFFLGDRGLTVRRNGEVDAVWLRRTMRDLDAAGEHANRFLAYASDGFKVALLLEAMALDCERKAVFESSFFDQLAYRLNPEHNRRRGPIVLWTCERPEVAHAKVFAPATPR